MSSTDICIIIAIAAYLVLMVYIGVRFARRNKSGGDFYLGGRQLGPVVTAMSAEASDMSSWLLMGLPGVAYLSGLCEAGWTAIGLAVGTYLNWLIVAKRIRRYTALTDSITIPQFFSNRFRDSSHALEGIAAVVIIVFFVPYTASGFAACGKLFHSLFGVDYLSAMLICGCVIAVYTMLGGFLAASTTDLIQSCVMTLAIFVILGFGLYESGGISNVLANVQDLPGYLTLTGTYNVETGGKDPYSIITIVSVLAWGLGYFGMPHILLRFMAIRDDRKLKVSRRIAIIWVVIAMAVAIAIGVVGLNLSEIGVVETLEGSDSENILIRIAAVIAQNNVLTALIAGVILAGILAATMSTADSQLLAAASSVTENLVQGVFRRKISARTNVILARATVAAIAVIAMLLATDPDSSVFRIVSFAWAGFGGAFGAVVLFSLYWRRMTRTGALAGMVSGGVMVFVWKFAVRPLGGGWDIYELLPAFLVSCACILIFSLLSKEPDKAVTDDFDAVRAMN